MPKLEEVYMDDVFAERPKLLSVMKRAGLMKSKEKRTSNDGKAVEAWEVVGNEILAAKRIGNLKLKHLSINGCQINDVVIEKIAPALIHIRKLNLADNPLITGAGWNKLFDILQENADLKFLSLKSSKQLNISTDNNEYFTQLAKLLSKMEEGDISGQEHISRDLLDHLKKINEDSQGQHFNLKRIILMRYPLGMDNNVQMNIPSLEICLSDTLNAKEVV